MKVKRGLRANLKVLDDTMNISKEDFIKIMKGMK